MSIFKKLKAIIQRPQGAKKEPEGVEKQERTEKRKDAPQGAEFVGRVLRAPFISEKAAVLADSGKYIFEVFPNANKIEIKKAVERLYGVSVTQVNVVNLPPKKRRRGRFEGLKSGVRKAIVTLKKGHTIEIMPH